jgi:hypothetical protein
MGTVAGRVNRGAGRHWTTGHRDRNPGQGRASKIPGPIQSEIGILANKLLTIDASDPLDQDARGWTDVGPSRDRREPPWE